MIYRIVLDSRTGQVVGGDSKNYRRSFALNFGGVELEGDDWGVYVERISVNAKEWPDAVDVRDYSLQFPMFQLRCPELSPSGTMSIGNGASSIEDSAPFALDPTSTIGIFNNPHTEAVTDSGGGIQTLVSDNPTRGEAGNGLGTWTLASMNKGTPASGTYLTAVTGGGINPLLSVTGVYTAAAAASAGTWTIQNNNGVPASGTYTYVPGSTATGNGTLSFPTLTILGSGFVAGATVGSEQSSAKHTILFTPTSGSAIVWPGAAATQVLGPIVLAGAAAAWNQTFKVVNPGSGYQVVPWYYAPPSGGKLPANHILLTMKADAPTTAYPNNHVSQDAETGKITVPTPYVPYASAKSYYEIVNTDGVFAPFKIQRLNMSTQRITLDWTVLGEPIKTPDGVDDDPEYTVVLAFVRSDKTASQQSRRF